MHQTIFFDLDGTLTDPTDGITRSIRYALGRLGFGSPGEADLTWCIGPPLLGSFVELVGEAMADDALTLYRERFSEIGWQENVPYPGIHEVLADLKAAGRDLYVATSKPWVFAERIVDHFELAPYFTTVFGSELDGTRGDKDSLLRHALAATAGGRPATMVGDRKYDIEGGQQNGMHTIGVTYGFGGREELNKAGADVIVDNLAALASELA